VVAGVVMAAVVMAGAADKDSDAAALYRVAVAVYHRGMESFYRAYLETLRQTEMLPAAHLAAWQWPQMVRMVAHAAQHTDFYAERLRRFLSAGARPEHWHAIPPVTRSQIQDANQALWAREVPAQAGSTRADETSGSTGIPLRYGWCDLASTSTRMQMERFWDWHGIDTGKTFAEIRLMRQRKNDERRHQGWSFRDGSGIAANLKCTVPLERQVQWLHDVRPDYLLSFPSHLDNLAGAMAQSGRPLALDVVLTVGEMLTDPVRERVAKAFSGIRSARVVDTYGCQEAGKLALQCPHGRYHVCAENVFLEIIDDDGRPVGPGEEGWVTITSLHNFVTPFIRYRLGDRAVAADGAPCPCGRQLPVLGQILGRARNVLTLPDGRRLWPASYMALQMREYVALRQFQVIQTAPGHLELRYVPMDGAAAPDVDGLTAHVRRAFHPDMTISLTALADIPRSAGGKFEDFISLVS